MALNFVYRISKVGCEDIIESDEVVPTRNSIVVPIKSIIVNADGFDDVGPGKVFVCIFIWHQSNSCLLVVCKEVILDVEAAVGVVWLIGIVDELDSVSAVAYDLVVSDGDVD